MNTRLTIIDKAETIKLWNLEVYDNLLQLLQTKYKFQKDLAKDLDINYSHLSKTLHGKTFLVDKQLQKWLDRTRALLNSPTE